MNLNKI